MSYIKTWMALSCTCNFPKDWYTFPRIWCQGRQRKWQCDRKWPAPAPIWRKRRNQKKEKKTTHSRHTISSIISVVKDKQKHVLLLQLISLPPLKHYEVCAIRDFVLWFWAVVLQRLACTVSEGVFTLSKSSPFSHKPNTFCSSEAALLWAGNWSWRETVMLETQLTRRWPVHIPKSEPSLSVGTDDSQHEPFVKTFSVWNRNIYVGIECY